MRNTMFMSKSERQERADKIWNYATLISFILGLSYLGVAMFAINTLKDSWAFVAWGAFSGVSIITCFIRSMIRERQ